MKMRAFEGALYLCVCLLLCECPGVELKKSKRQNSRNGEVLEKGANVPTQNVDTGDGKRGTEKSKTLKKQRSVSHSGNKEKSKDGTNSLSITKLRGSKRQKKKEKKKIRNRDKEETTGFYRSDKMKCPDNLNSQLVKFYDEEVHLAVKERKSAIKIIDEFLVQLWNHLQVNLDDLHFKKYTLVGSMSEDLSTKTISDFDFHLLLNIGDAQLTSAKIPKAPGYSFLYCTRGDLCDNFGKVQDGKSHLNPQAFIRKLQSIVQKTLDSDKIPLMPGCSKYRPGYKGPTVTVVFDCVLDGKQLTFRVELVPLLEMTGKKFVAKSIARDVDTTFELSWRESYTDQERALIKKKSSEDLTVLRLMKHIVRHKAKPFNFLTSYSLKNVYIHMDVDDYPWQTKRLCDQLMDFLHVLFTYAKKRSLPCQFDSSNNLFLSLSSSGTIRNLQSTLQKVLENYEANVKEWIDFPDLKDEL